MASQVPTNVPSGNTAFIGIPDSEDIPRLVYAAPYFQQVPLAELIEPSVIEAVNNVLPSLVPPYVDAAAQAAVQAQAVLLVGSTMTGPLFLNPVMPSADAQAASKAYVDTMLSTAGIPEVPPVPSGQVWARETGQWVPISQTGGTFLPIAGGSMQGNINMSGNTITNMAAVPAMPNGAAPAQWVLNQIASVSLYQGTWDADTNVPDLTQLSTHVNAYTWIALTTSPSGVVIGPAIPGLQGTTVFNGDTIIYSTVQGGFKAIHSGGITLPEADGRYVQLAGSQMSGALLLNANATQPLQATTLQQLDAAVANTVTPDAPADGQAYLRLGIGATRWVPGLPLAGGILTGSLTLSGNATANLQAVPLQQVNSLITAGTTGFLPLAGGQMTGLMQLSANASANLNPVPLQQLNAMLQTYAPIQNPSFTGTVTLPGNAASALQAVPLQQLTAGYLPLTGGNLSGNLTLTGGSGTGNITVGTSPSAVLFGGTSPFATIQGNSASGGSLLLSTQSGANLGTINLFATTTAMSGAATVAGTLQAGNTISQTNASAMISSAGPIYAATATRSNFGLQSIASGPAFFWLPTYYHDLDTASGEWRYYPASASNPVFRVLLDGNMFISGNLNQGSDETTKTDIQPIAQGISLIRQLLPKSYQRIQPPAEGVTLPPPRTEWGFVAQDVEPVIPTAVTQGPAQTDGSPGLFGLDYNALVATVVNAVKQLDQRCTALEANANITPPAAELA